MWQKATSAQLDGLSGDGGNANKKFLSNGGNGFRLATDLAYGTMAVTNNTNNFAATAAADATLGTNSDYVLFTGTGAPWASGGLEFGGVTFSVNRLNAPVTGIYRLEMWSTISAFPTNTAKIAAKYRVNGAAFSPRRPIVKSNGAGDSGQLSGFGMISLSAGDYVQLYIASTASGSLVFTDINLTLELVRQTA